MDCPHRIPPSGTPAHHHRLKSHSSHHSRSTLGHRHEDRYRCSWSRSQSTLANITAKVTITPTEAIPGHTLGIIDDITGVVHDAHIQPLTHIVFTVTLHITDPLCIEALQLTPEITANLTLDQPTNPPRKLFANLHHIPGDHQAKHIPKGIQELQYMSHKWTITVWMTIPVTQGRTQTI